MVDGLRNYRLLADGNGAALVAPDGSVPWFCAPRYDSTPVLWSLLAGEGDGAAAWLAGVSPVPGDGVPAAAVLTTRVMAPCGRVEIVDRIANGALRRLIRCVDGDLEVAHVTRLGQFDGAPPVETVVQPLTAGCNQWRGVMVTE